MPSLFSRSRTTSTPQRTHTDAADLDEFGRVSSRGLATPTPASKKDKKRVKQKSKADQPDPDDNDDDQQLLPALPDGSFLPLTFSPPSHQTPSNLDTPQHPSTSASAASLQGGPQGDMEYGYLSYERHVVLGLEQLHQLVEVLVEELETRGGITTPFIFSSTALDISVSGIKRLIRTFLNFCRAQMDAMQPGSHREKGAERAWREEARFAGPHELGMCLRWGLARAVRIMGGQEVRGLLSWEQYVEFRDSEAALNYPPTHFATLLPTLNPLLQSILVRVLSLLTRLTANSTSSGHTPPTLSPLFGPLLFGLGPASCGFHQTYVHYLRAVNATEHLILAFIRWQDTPTVAAATTMTTPSHNGNAAGTILHPSNSASSTGSGAAATLGVPIRLKEWIKGYPAMLPFLVADQQQRKKDSMKPQPRKGAKTVTVTSVRRNVRIYTKDLVRSAAGWATHAPPNRGQGLSNAGMVNAFANSKEWERIAPKKLKLTPKYSDGYKKRMNLPSGFQPDTMGSALTLLSSRSSADPIPSSGLARNTSPLPDRTKDYFGLGEFGLAPTLEAGKKEGQEKFRSLTDMKWGEFETIGFGGLEAEKKLQFDLTESARESRSAKRQTMSWNDFSTAGFSRNEPALKTTLQFSTPLAHSVSSWSQRDHELEKKLKKTEKRLPAFGWDTEPVMGHEEVIEEAFLDVFCDLVYGGGWIDKEREKLEGVDRDCNWALVEFRSLPQGRITTSGVADPRTSTTLILFEEFIPLEYRQKLALLASKSKGGQLHKFLPVPSFLSPNKKGKHWKQAATLNGRPYVVGHVPSSPSFREMEFEGLLREEKGTKVIKASGRIYSTISTATAYTEKDKFGEGEKELPPPVPPLPTTLQVTTYAGSSSGPGSAPRSDDTHTDSPAPASMKKTSNSRFKIAVPSPVNRRSMKIPAEYSAVEFETRLAVVGDSDTGEGYDEHRLEDDELELGSVRGKNKRKNGASKGDEAWVDILVNSQGRRMAGQDVDPALVKGRGDPDMASREVAQVLAAVRERERSLSLSETEREKERVDKDYGLDAHLEGLEIDEIETVPGILRSSEESAYDDREEYEDGEDEYAADAEGADEYEVEPEMRKESDAEPEEPEALLPIRKVLRQQRRLGYFDLHPERKPGHLQTQDLDNEEGQNQYPFPSGAAATSNKSSPHLDSQTPTPTQMDPTSGIPKFDQTEESRREEAEQSFHPRPDSTTLPALTTTTTAVTPPVKTGNGAMNHPVGPRMPVQGTKTAALIEMYRERERKGMGVTPSTTVTTAPIPTVAPLQPSRVPVPVRSSSLSTEPTPAVPVLAIPAPAMPLTSAPQPTRTIAGEPVIPGLEEAGRASPARYVHGAPLHNVLEEPEEED